MNQPDLSNLINSVEHAESIVSRMEASIGQLERHKETTDILKMHRFIMKVYAVIILVLMFGMSFGSIIVTNIANYQKSHTETNNIKFENLVVSFKQTQEANRMMMVHLMAIQEEMLKNANKKAAQK